MGSGSPRTSLRAGIGLEDHRMATPAQWLEATRPRTLPASVAPVLAGTGAAAQAGNVVWWKAVLALLLALALQVGVNFANDYSDGVRGTDAVRVGPARLVASGAVPARAVKLAAGACFAVAALLGLVLALSSAWWLVFVGAACIGAAWYYTGGRRPYGYRGLGEVSVFVFFGLVATVGTAFVQADGADGAARIGWPAVVTGAAVGLLACAVLMANNLRDLSGDAAVGKRTLAVRLGERRARMGYAALVTVPYVLVFVLAATGPAVLLAFGSLPLAIRGIRAVSRGATGMALVPVLRDTGLAELVFGALLGVGLALTG
jgi:1,4-dihydroxy-2-naphthoate octaprenyltransferase